MYYELLTDKQKDDCNILNIDFEAEIELKLLSIAKTAAIRRMEILTTKLANLSIAVQLDYVKTQLNSVDKL